MSQSPQKTLVLASLGGILEFYDFIIYALLAGLLTRIFFGAHDSIVGLLGAFATYSVGYLIRPLGGVVLGHFGDRYSRKATFTTSVAMMAGATLAIGLLPTYEQIGWVAPLLLTLLRMAQGFSVGGEIPGAYTYISELFPNRQGLYCGILSSSITFGVVLGSLTVAILQSFLTETQLYSWGWRLPFIGGGCLGFISLYYRQYLQESQEFLHALRSRNSLPIIELLQHYRAEVTYGFSLIALAATTASLLYIYIPAYLQQIMHYQDPNFMWYYSITLALSALGNTVVGYYSDHLNRSRFISYMCGLTIVVSYPCYWLLSHAPQYAVIALLLGAIPNAMAFGMFARQVANLFPTHVRYSGLALCYSGGFALFGGLTPLLATYLIYATKQLTAPCYVIIVIAIITLSMHWHFLGRRSAMPKYAAATT